MVWCQRSIPAFARTGHALRLGMERRTAHMAHTLGFDGSGQFAGDVAGSIVRQQIWLVMDAYLGTAKGCQRHIQRVGDILPTLGSKASRR